ncbi:MAG: RnfABCDGE type electron transport complex subunit C [Gammaproteobacteria bacterium]|nr:RnfABCDGE type electron transport complex subunit C [Gammaproteobacteria bacterium]
MKIRKLPEMHIEGYKEMSISREPQVFLAPKSVFLPTEFPAPLKVMVNPGDHVKMGQVVLLREGRFGHPILSPISGTVIGTKKRWHQSNKMMNMLEIENDFKEEMVDDFKNLDPENMSREELVDLMKRVGLTGMGGAGFPAYAKYATDKKVETIIINLAECEPFITCDFTSVLKNPDMLVYGLKYLIKAAGTDKAVIAIKDKEINKQLIDVLIPKLEPNMSIHYLRDVYPAGWEKYTVEQCTGKTYAGLPIEAGAIVTNASTCISFANVLKNGITPSMKYVTFTGDAIKEPGNVLCKNGTNILDLLPLFGGLKEGLTKDECSLIAGGPMTGSSMFSEDFVTSMTLGAVIILKDKLEGRFTPHCLGCGNCAKYCPVFLSPYEIKRVMKTGNVEELKELEVSKCIQCGLCSYVCPSRIDLTSQVIMAKGLVRRLG